MNDLVMDLSHLAQADQHIAQAHDLIAQATKRHGSQPDTADESLPTMREALAAFEGHRALILQTIADISAGTRRSA